MAGDTHGGSGTALLVILGMAVATYAARAGGYWLMGRVPLSGRLERALRHVPGAVLVAIIAPTVVAGGLAEKAAALATALAALRTGNLLVSLACGVGVVLAVRAVLHA